MIAFSRPFVRLLILLASTSVVVLLLVWLASTSAVRAQSGYGRYAESCRRAIGAIPDFSCASGAIVPVTVDGHTVSAPRKDMACDRPGLLPNGSRSDGQCVPNSRILSLSTKTMQVAVMCRQKRIRPPGSLDFDELNITAHNPLTGATCWFQAEAGNGKPIAGRHVPSPMSKAGEKLWHPPEETVKAGCGMCHDSGPMMYSPFVGQVWNRMPVDPFGPYSHVDPAHYGFDRWPTKAFAPRDNTCIGCHRIGTKATCSNLTQWMTGRAVPADADAWARRFPGSHGMPPNLAMSERSWNEIYGAATDQILSCCAKPDQPVCRLHRIEGAGD